MVNTTGTACYQIATFAALLAVPSLRKCLLSDAAVNSQSAQYTALLATHMRRVCNSSKAVRCNDLLARASDLRERFSEGQHDASEFLASLIEQLAAEPALASWMQQLRRQESNNLLCLACDKSWTVRERDPEQLVMLAVRQSSAPTSLLECLSGYSAPAVPRDFVCRGCKAKSCTSKSVEVKAAPRLLVVVLKRMLFDGARARKVTSPVAVPLSLHYAGRDYELNSLVVHRGSSTASGHYVTFGKCSVN